MSLTPLEFELPDGFALPPHPVIATDEPFLDFDPVHPDSPATDSAPAPTPAPPVPDGPWWDERMHPNRPEG